MHMGGWSTIGALRVDMTHVVLNNGAHDSVGGQPTAARKVSLCAIAEACGYSNALLARDELELRGALCTGRSQKGPVFIEAIVRKGARKNLGRPTQTPLENKLTVMKTLAQ
jgi:phosphonopyruvate decarboxylase